MARASIPDHVLFRSFGTEMVLLNLQTGQYHGLNKTGARIVELLVEFGDTDEVAKQMAAEFDASVEQLGREIDELCAALAQRALIQVHDGPGG